VEIHLAIPNYGPGSTPEAITEIAEEAEALGFDGVASTDHLLVPRGQPERYERIFEALAVLAYLTGRTRRVKLITSVVVVLMRNPFAVAKQAATIDRRQAPGRHHREAGHHDQRRAEVEAAPGGVGRTNGLVPCRPSQEPDPAIPGVRPMSFSVLGSQNRAETAWR
jgi:alkanesulfonate monooxygenase SsuD/methylene tetrahydromethanopterin reductase-like flavin-dependent oxidoreductase (luciferase family)